ncbi:MAG: type ISP restriction/modification enzyme [Ferrimicrobium sp.]
MAFPVGDTLKKMLPRIPLAEEFWAFADAGRKLGEIYLSYEEIRPYPLIEETEHELVGENYQVTKMRFDKVNGTEDRTRIRYNEHLTLAGIPERAHDYVVNGRSAISWIMERYQLKRDSDSGIVNDPNTYSDNPRYIVDLLKKVATVNIVTLDILDSLPELSLEVTQNS